MLRGFEPEPIHTLIGAARGILYGLSRNDPNLVLIKWDASVLTRVFGNDEAQIRRCQNRVSNFLKHADRDPKDVLDGYDLDGLNRIELQLCIIALGFYGRTLSAPLNAALLYFGRSSDAIFPFAEVVETLDSRLPGSRQLVGFDEDVWVDAILKLLETSRASHSPDK